MSGIYISTGAFREGRLAEMAEACETLGAGLELSSGVRWHAGLGAEIDGVVKRKGKLLVHNYFPPPQRPFVLNLASTQMQTLKKSMEHAHAAIDLCARCGAPFYSVHSGFAMDLAAEDLGKPETQARTAKVPYALAYSIFLSSVRGLSAYAKQHGVRLLIENNVITGEQADLLTAQPREKSPLERLLNAEGADPEDRARLAFLLKANRTNAEEIIRLMRLVEEGVITGEQLNSESPLLMTEPGELAKFFRHLDDPNVGLLLDVGHAKVSADALGFEPGRYFEDLASWIGAVHLSDNDGFRDNNRPFGEDAWFGEYYLGNVPLVIEVYGVGIEGAAKMVDVAKRWVGEK